MTPRERAQLTRQQRLSIMKAKQRHPSWDTEKMFLNIVCAPDMIIFNKEANARLAGGAKV